MNEILLTILLAALGVLIGGLITLLAARIYYEKASRDLAVEAEKLKQLNELMLRAMEYAGLAEFSRDEDGNIKGMTFRLTPESGSAKVSGSAPTLSVSSKKQ